MITKSIRNYLTRYKIIALLIAIFIIWSFFGLQDEEFLSPRNFSNLLRQMAITGMLASGMVFVIISGEIDLSVGSFLGLMGGIASVLDVEYHLPLPVNIALVCVLGMIVGAGEGYLVAYRRIPSFIVSLGGMLAYRGAVLGITKGITVAPVAPNFVQLGQGYLPRGLGDGLAVLLFGLLSVQAYRTRANRLRYDLAVPPVWQEFGKLVLFGLLIVGFVAALDDYNGIPIPVLVLMVILGILTVMANKTVFGRRIYAVGSNIEAVRMSGVNVQSVKLKVFVIMGLMCAFAGLATTARLAAGSPSAGNMGELDAIASCFIGGASARGGVGTVIGALIGALIMASLDNGMSMLGVDTFWQMIVKGCILVLAVWIDIMSGSER